MWHVEDLATSGRSTQDVHSQVVSAGPKSNRIFSGPSEIPIGFGRGFVGQLLLLETGEPDFRYCLSFLVHVGWVVMNDLSLARFATCMQEM